jgi:hypothetical protein
MRRKKMKQEHADFSSRLKTQVPTTRHLSRESRRTLATKEPPSFFRGLEDLGASQLWASQIVLLSGPQQREIARRGSKAVLPDGDPRKSTPVLPTDLSSVLPQRLRMLSSLAKTKSQSRAK